MRRHPIQLIALVLFLGSMSATMVAAQEAVDAARGAQKDASEHFRRGVDLFQEGDFRSALVEFQRANEIVPDYRLLYNIGMCHLQLLDYVEATQTFERYLAEGGSAIEPGRRAEVEGSLGLLRDRLARLEIIVNMVGAKVFVDDRLIGVSPLSGPVVVNVGRHRVQARNAAGLSAEQTITVAGGDARAIALEIVAREIAQSAPEEQKLSRKKRTALALWGVTVGAIGSAVVCGVMASSKADELDAALEVKPPAGLADAEQTEELRDSADRLAITADVLGATAIAAGATGLVLWLLKDGMKTDRKQATARARPLTVTAGFGSVGVVGSF